MATKIYGVTNFAFNDDTDNSKYLLTDAGETKTFKFPDSMDEMSKMFPTEEIQFTSQNSITK